MIPKRDYYKYPSYFLELMRSFFASIRTFCSIIFSWGRGHDKALPGKHHSGLHVLKADSTGKIECDACHICEEQCPAQCITVEGHKNQFKSFSIDITKCTFCGICAEVCPIDAISLGKREVRPGFAEQRWQFDQEILAYRDDINPL